MEAAESSERRHQRKLLPAPVQRAWQAVALWRPAALLRRSAWFDADWYWTTYPEVARSGSDAARHYLRSGAKAGYDPGPRFSTRDYLRRNPDVAAAGLNPLVHYLRFGAAEGRAPSPRDPGQREPGPPQLAPAAPTACEPPRAALGAVPAVFARAFPELVPLRLFRVADGAPPRLSLLIDRVGPEALFRAEATPIVLAALAAASTGRRLRIVTELEPSEASAVGTVLAAYGIAAPPHIEVAFLDSAVLPTAIAAGTDDIWLTASWSATRKAVRAAGAEHVVYLVQSDERLACPGGDRRRLIDDLLGRRDIRAVVAGDALREHLAATGAADLARAASVFEPAVPRRAAGARDAASGGKRRLMIDARSDQANGLPLRTLALIDRALLTGAILPREWEIWVAGDAVPPFTFSTGLVPRRAANLSWHDWQALAATVDLGISLRDAPGLSDTVLDLASHGAVALTNRFGPQQVRAQAAGNILVAQPGEDALFGALRQGAALAQDCTLRAKNYDAMTFPGDWDTAVAETVRHSFSERRVADA